MTNSKISRGDIFYADLSPVVGSEQGGIRPVVVIQNNTGNRYSPTVIVAAITSSKNKGDLPTHIEIDGSRCGLPCDSTIILEQVRTIDKRRLREYVGRVDLPTMNELDYALLVSFGISIKSQIINFTSKSKKELSLSLA